MIDLPVDDALHNSLELPSNLLGPPRKSQFPGGTLRKILGKSQEGLGNFSRKSCSETHKCASRNRAQSSRNQIKSNRNQMEIKSKSNQNQIKIQSKSKSDPNRIQIQEKSKEILQKSQLNPIEILEFLIPGIERLLPLTGPQGGARGLTLMCSRTSCRCSAAGRALCTWASLPPMAPRTGGPRNYEGSPRNYEVRIPRIPGFLPGVLPGSCWDFIRIHQDFDFDFDSHFDSDLLRF